MKIILLTITLSLFLSFDILGQKTKFGLYGEIVKSQNLVSSESSFNGEIKSESKFGFGVGTSFHFREAKNVSFRITSGLNYLTEEVRYEYSNGGYEELKRGYIFLKVPGHALFKLGKSDFRFVAGINPSINLVGGDENNYLNFKRFNIAGDIGINYGIQINKISIIPELKYSHSFINGVDNSSSYANRIDNYLRNRFMLTLFITW